MTVDSIVGTPPDTRNQPVRERRKIADLKPYPLQKSIFGDLPDHRLSELRDSITSRGMDRLPEILPDGTIVKGHQRIRAAEQNGETEVDVVVRYDLADDPARAAREFLEDNLLGRQLSPMQTARGYVALASVHAENLPSKQEQANGRPDCMHQRLATILGVSPKTVKRYIDATGAPLKVQEALDRREIKLEHAARVGRLPEETKRAIERALRLGKSPKTIVCEYVARGDAHVNPDTQLLNALAKAVRNASMSSGQQAAIEQIERTSNLVLLERGHEVLDDLSQHLKQAIRRLRARQPENPRTVAGRRIGQ